ncbi:MAG: hypothetical protein WC556_13360 [Candidatus Methanoperedens sp.]
MPYKFFHPCEQYENYERKKKYLENASGQLCRCYPKMPPYLLSSRCRSRRSMRDAAGSRRRGAGCEWARCLLVADILIDRRFYFKKISIKSIGTGLTGSTGYDF